VHDIISGASGTAGPGRAYLYSGRTGGLLHVWEGAHPLDAFGSAVASAGDQDHDGFADAIVGAQGDDTAGEDAGAAYIYSAGPTDCCGGSTARRAAGSARVPTTSARTA
jgi:FG-GAP repeat